LEQKIKFWGKVDNRQLEEVYAETDVIVLPSIWPENQPVSITEAMAARRPVIASRIGGIPELVDDGKTGYLFDPGDARQLASRMMEFISHPERIHAFGESAHKKILGNTFEERVRLILKVYDNDNPKTEGPTQEEDLIVCVGKYVGEMCSEAMDLTERRITGRSYRFVMADWLETDQIRDAKVFWVVDSGITLDDVAALLQFQVPLLVPESSEELRALCINANCGLYFADAIEAAECLEHLCENPDEASVIGKCCTQFLFST